MGDKNFDNIWLKIIIMMINLQERLDKTQAFCYDWNNRELTPN